MSRWRVLVVAGLLSTPVLIWTGVGMYYLWKIGWGFYAWWPLMAMMALGWVLAWYWQRQRTLLRPPDFDTPAHWTDRDKGAWKLVETRAEKAADVPIQKLSEPAFYLQSAQEMAKELAAYYHPGAQDPIDNVTVPELLAVVELASGDLWELVEENLPGGHLLTIRDWKRSRQLIDYYQTGSNIYWAIAAVFNPVQTGMRYIASKYGIGQPLQMLQQNLFAWFYVAFVHRLGRYLVDLNSGRLRIGAARYRELVSQLDRRLEQPETVAEKVVAGPFPVDARATRDPAEHIGQVTITIFGQVKAGKSSLVNALLGEQRAQTGVIPTTEGIERYELLAPGVPTKLALQDTVGYGQEGPRADQVRQTAEAARHSDLLFLALHARNPARKADVEMLDQLRQWFVQRPDLKMPAVVAVLTHVDLLSPAMEWTPPYDWTAGKRTKEVNIRDAVKAVKEQLGERVVSVVPVCGSPGRLFGIDEALLPAVSNWLDEAHGVALLRCLKAEADRDRAWRVWQQVRQSGTVLMGKVAELMVKR